MHEIQTVEKRLVYLYSLVLTRRGHHRIIGRRVSTSIVKFKSCGEVKTEILVTGSETSSSLCVPHIPDKGTLVRRSKNR